MNAECLERMVSKIKERHNACDFKKIAAIASRIIFERGIGIGDYIVDADGYEVVNGIQDAFDAWFDAEEQFVNQYYYSADEADNMLRKCRKEEKEIRTNWYWVRMNHYSEKPDRSKTAKRKKIACLRKARRGSREEMWDALTTYCPEHFPPEWYSGRF